MVSNFLTAEKDDKTFRLLLLGSAGVGKTAFAVKLMTGRFIGDYSNQSELMYRDTGKILNDAKVNTIEVMDTSSKQYQTSKFNKLILWCDAVVIIYSICDHSSFAEAQRLKITAKMMRREHRLIEPAWCFYGNKADEEADRIVSRREVTKTASICADLFVEGSAKTSLPNELDSIVMKLFTRWCCTVAANNINQSKQSPKMKRRRSSELVNSSAIHAVCTRDLARQLNGQKKNKKYFI